MIKVELKGVDQAVAQLRDLPRRVQVAAVAALTRTAVAVREAEQREMRDVFDRPTPYTLGSLFVQPATLVRPEAKVGVKDDGGGSRSAVKWLRWQVLGGLRTPTALERRLMAAGAMRNDQRAVPGQFARRDAYGNISTGQIRQMLSQLRIELTQGAKSVLPTLSRDESAAAKAAKRLGMKALPLRQQSLAKDARGKINRINAAYRRAGGQFVAFPNGRGKLVPGIYLVRDTAFGRSDPKPVLIFVSKAEYEAGRFDFDYVARRTVERTLPLEMQRALEQIAQQRGRA